MSSGSQPGDAMPHLWRLVGSVVAVALVIVHAVGSQFWVSVNPDWYASLTRPRWQPPDLVVGLIWHCNVLALGVGGVLVALRGLRNRRHGAHPIHSPGER